MAKRPSNIKELRDSDYRVLSVRAEVRKNLIAALESGRDIFPGIIGFDETVVPQVQNAILAGQDMILLGERGQAKSRLTRSLVALLDEYVPYIAGCEVNDNPFKPICRPCKDRLAEEGDKARIEWLRREDRYGEKLATPDISVADLIGDIDPIKVAEGRYLSDELTMHFGLIPRTNRGIFSINELPDLSERIQVSLFNLMEERDIQIRGFRIMLPLDVMLVASANPEDYTNRGRIITPIKDRYGAQIRTHYPETAAEELAIVEQEYTKFPDVDERVYVPEYMKQVIAELTHHARRSPEINQGSGVSLRVSISNYETLLSAAFRRALLQGERAAPRVSDLPGLLASTAGKIELETVEEGREAKVVDALVNKAVATVFGSYFQPSDLDELVLKFDEGLVFETGADVPSADYAGRLANLDGVPDLIGRVETSEAPEAIASATEFILEGLHLSRLNRESVSGRYRYSH